MTLTPTSPPRFQIRKMWQLDKQTFIFNIINLSSFNQLVSKNKKFFLIMQLPLQEAPLKVVHEKPDFKPIN